MSPCCAIIAWNTTLGVVPTCLRPRARDLDLASKRKGARHTFNYELVNGPDPEAQVSSVWRIPTVPKSEKRMGYHPTQNSFVPGMFVNLVA